MGTSIKVRTGLYHNAEGAGEKVKAERGTENAPRTELTHDLCQCVMS